MTDQNILCLDIGSGTQDVLYFMSGRELENCPKFVLPSPALGTAKRIEELHRAGRSIYLYGRNMGGGFYRVLKKCLGQGLQAAIHPEAAYSLSDSMEAVKGMGLEISAHCPEGYAPVYLADFDPGFWGSFLAQAGLSYPEMILACAQDHGFHPGASNRLGRFEIWKKFLLQSSGHVQRLIFSRPPAEMTRLISLKESIGAGFVADTGAAALLGALFVPEVEELARNRGICVVNVGNSHTIAFLVYQDRVHGILEHHTGLLDGQSLWEKLNLFKHGHLTNQQVFDENGHGCLILDSALDHDFKPTFVLGPKRSMLQGFDVNFLCPGGDMMLAGCFGLLKGYFLIR
ncbi:DUF1786 domain-containing protein [Desulfonatronovibrio hydrogenovorans]|uniref:DUF1786 domain-containing protein n=1 Tax=Desulfonatronovibrio hydrogenovorans TaxID=53245 RepID=UPI00048B165F|nr:DUF1786 domain-containing protein [Desulfonatronovibrio hydrogenovorans]